MEYSMESSDEIACAGDETSGVNDYTSVNDETSKQYIKKALNEKLQLDAHQFPISLQLLEQEIDRTKELGKTTKEFKYIDIYRGKPIRLTQKVLVPIIKGVRINLVGKLLGPKGNSLRRLQEETLCKINVKGRGSMKDKVREEELRKSLDPKYHHLTEHLHVEVSTIGPPAEAHARMAHALTEIRKYLIPDNQDEISLEQMREMELIERGENLNKNEHKRGYKRQNTSNSSYLAQKMPKGNKSSLGTNQGFLRRPNNPNQVMSIMDRVRISMEDQHQYQQHPQSIPPQHMTSQFKPQFNKRPFYYRYEKNF